MKAASIANIIHTTACAYSYVVCVQKSERTKWASAHTVTSRVM